MINAARGVKSCFATIFMAGILFFWAGAIFPQDGNDQKRSTPVERRADGEDSDKLVLQHTSKIFNNFLKIMHDPDNEENLKQSFSSMAGNFVSFLFDATRRGEIESLENEQEVKGYVYRKLSGIFNEVRRRRSMARN